MSEPSSTDEMLPWPQPVRLPESRLTQLHRAVIAFLDAANDLGAKPRENASGTRFEAGFEGKRGVAVGCGGSEFSRRWIVFFSDHGDNLETVYLVGFELASNAALRWLKGDPLDAILKDLPPDAKKTWPK